MRDAIHQLGVTYPVAAWLETVMTNPCVDDNFATQSVVVAIVAVGALGSAGATSASST
jgi:hypothetical protein